MRRGEAGFENRRKVGKKMAIPPEIPFSEVVAALLDADNPLPPKFLYRLSDLTPEDLDRLESAWPDIPAWRRKALMEDVEALGEDDTLLSFEAVGRFAIRDEDPQVRLPAVRTLWEFEEPDLATIFLNMTRHEPDAAVRAAAVSGLGRFIYAGEIDELAPELLRAIENRLLEIEGSDEPTLVRRRALEALGFSSRDEVPALIETAYASGEKDWIASALFAMGRSANEVWQPQVLAMLDNPLPALRSEAARAAGELEISASVPRLLDLIDDPDPETRRASIWSLSQIGGEGVRDTLENLYENSEDEDDVDLLEEALDNLAFTEDMQLMPLFDFPEDEIEENPDDDPGLFEDDEESTG
jgi:HEAT repeat protein